MLRLPGDPPSPWEGLYGYSRVVRAGDAVFVGGTTSISERGVDGGDAYSQAVIVLQRIAAELGRAGATLADVVSMRAYVTDIRAADQVGRAFGEALGDVRPVMTMIEVSRLIDERMLVEIEATAVIGFDANEAFGPGSGAFPEDP
jgi:enamine deaminase RidA (YjgF/YER057c/UK114 family)